MTILEFENLELKEKLKVCNKILKGKGKVSNLQRKLENQLKSTELKLNMAIERNDQLERDLVHVKKELNKSLKWTTFLKIQKT